MSEETPNPNEAVAGEGRRGPRIVSAPSATKLEDVKKASGLEQWWCLELCLLSGERFTIMHNNWQALRDAMFDTIRRAKLYVVIDGYRFSPGQPSIVQNQILSVRPEQVAVATIREIPTCFNAVQVDIEQVAATGL
jgi:hypothetical protein